MPAKPIPIKDRFWNKVDKSAGVEGCWIWIAAKNKKGYGVVRTVNRKMTIASRMAYELSFGPIPKGLFCLHHCDNPSCVNPAHLFLGTKTDNAQDMVRKGRQGFQVHPERVASGNKSGARKHPELVARGERNGNAKLVEWQVLEMRADYKHGGVSLNDLAKKYKVTKGLVGQIIRNEMWKHI